VLRGLAIRQAFLLGDWLVILLMVAGACYAAAHFLGIPLEQPGAQRDDVAVADPGGSGALAAVKPRAEYERIVMSGLFGSAGKAAQEKPAAAPPPVEEETKLRLKLCGTSATKPRDLFASAIILNEEKNQTGTFCVGQEVVDKVTLEEVWQRKVILLNKAANRREVLRSEPDTKEGAGGGAGPTAPQPKLTTGAGGNRVTLKKQEIVQDLVTNYADIVTQIKPELYHDAEGKVAGLTASNLESIPIAQKLGVKNGDVLQTVNNEVIDSEEKIMELVNKYRNSSTFRIGLLRDGKPLVVTYKLE
jgi:general secretion pathway protein C